MFSFEELKRRKLVQWTLAYVAGAWVVLQLLDVVAEPWGIGSGLLLAAQILLAFGFFATLVLAWYHGEQGRQRVSGPELLMLAALLVIAGGVIVLVRGDGEAPAAGADEAALAAGLASIPERSIAVLPLDDNSPNPDDAWFAGAMTEQITSALSRVPDLRVTSRGSASQFPESGMTVREFARELGVAHVLEGSVQRVEDQVQITVQLIDARTDEHLWSHTYERELTDVLDLQVEIARAIAERLAASFTEREEERILAGATDDPVAYDLYLRASEIPWVLATPEQLGEKTELLRRTVARDSTFGLAWADLGITYFVRSGSDGEEWTDSSRAALDRAVALTDGPPLAWVRAVRAILFRDVDRDETIARLREAVEAEPSNTYLLESLSILYQLIGDLPAAIRYARQAVAVDPLDASHWYWLSFPYRRLGLFDRAEAVIRRIIELEPEETRPWLQLIWLNILQGRYDAALAALDSAAARGDPSGPLWKGGVHVWAGELEDAHAAFAEAFEDSLEQASVHFLPTVAHVRSRQSDTSGARRMLERAEASLGTDPGKVRADADHWLALEIAAVRGDIAAAVQALREYVDAGGRNFYEIERSPVFSRVRQDSAFQAELARLEHIVERQRRQVEHDLAEEG